MNDHRPFQYLSLFTGGGGLDLGLHRAVRNARCVATVEVEAFARQVLVARMEENALDPCPVFSDVGAFDGTRFRGLVDAVIGGSPCQGLSLAGRRLGLVRDSRSRLFFEMVRIIEESRPQFIFWENVLGAKKYLPAIFAEFERVGFRGKGTVVRASDVGAPHQRARIFILARRVEDTDESRRRQWTGGVGEPPVASEFEDSGAVDDSAVERLSRPVRSVVLGRTFGSPRTGDVADTASDGRVERRTESDASREASADESGEVFWITCACGFEFVGTLSSLCPGCGEIRSGSTNVADASDVALWVESGRRSWASGPGTSVVGLAREVVADDDDERCESERGAGVLLSGTPRGDDVDGCGGAELVNSEGGGTAAVQQRGQRGGAVAADEVVADARKQGLQRGERTGASGEGAGASRSTSECSRPEWPPSPDGDWSGVPAHLYPSQPRVRRVVDGLGGGMELALAEEAVWADRLRMLGNGVVPAQAEAAFRFLYAAISTP